MCCSLADIGVRVFGVTLPKPPPNQKCYTLAYNYGYANLSTVNYLAVKNTANRGACCSLCARDPRCVAWTRVAGALAFRTLYFRRNEPGSASRYAASHTCVSAQRVLWTNRSTEAIQKLLQLQRLVFQQWSAAITLSAQSGLAHADISGMCCASAGMWRSIRNAVADGCFLLLDTGGRDDVRTCYLKDTLQRDPDLGAFSFSYAPPNLLHSFPEVSSCARAVAALPDRKTRNSPQVVLASGLGHVDCCRSPLLFC